MVLFVALLFAICGIVWLARGEVALGVVLLMLAMVIVPVYGGVVR